MGNRLCRWLAHLPVGHRIRPECAVYRPHLIRSQSGHCHTRRVGSDSAGRAQSVEGDAEPRGRSMIRVQDLAVTFNGGTPMETRALRGVAVEIPAGQFVTVIGSNGAGKSSLLNALAGDVSASAGRIEIDKEDVTRWPATRRAGLMARVFQDPKAGSCEELTIEENLAIADGRGRRRGLGRAIDRRRRDDYRARLSRLSLGLEGRLGDRMGLLSGGQRQAVSLLMATLRPMRILLLDEHTAALDPRTAEFVLNLTRAIVSEQQPTTL